mgnify:CR=1 FL=1
MYDTPTPVMLFLLHILNGWYDAYDLLSNTLSDKKREISVRGAVEKSRRLPRRKRSLVEDLELGLSQGARVESC